MILDPPEVIVHEATNNTDDIVYTLQQVEKIEARFQFQSIFTALFCNIFIENDCCSCNTFRFLSLVEIDSQ